MSQARGAIADGYTPEEIGHYLVSGPLGSEGRDFFLTNKLMRKIEGKFISFWQGVPEPEKEDFGNNTDLHAIMRVSAGQWLIENTQEALQKGGVSGEELFYGFAAWLDVNMYDTRLFPEGFFDVAFGDFYIPEGDANTESLEDIGYPYMDRNKIVDFIQKASSSVS